MLKYPCLVLDHDDTVVQSETTINYPFFCYILDQFRPGATITLDEYVSGCFSPGFVDMCRQRFQFTDQELVDEYNGWMEYVKTHIFEPLDKLSLPIVLLQCNQQLCSSSSSLESLRIVEMLHLVRTILYNCQEYS